MLHPKLAICAGILCSLCLLPNNNTYAQAHYVLPPADTIRLDFKQAEKIFLDSNLQLLAAHYNIQGAQALAEQARKWDNPTLVTDQNVYSNNRFFEHRTDAAGNPQGQVYVQVQQLIKTAGKRGKEIDLAKTNVTIAEWQFRTVMRNLRAELYQDFYTVALLRGNALLYAENLQQLNKLMAAQEQSLKAGNIARKEYLRIQALVIALHQDITNNNNALNDAESELKTLLQITGNKFILPVAPDTEPAVMPSLGIMALIDSARHNNTDYRQQTYQLQYSSQSLRLQKALAVPDVTLGPEYDQNSNYTPNYYGLGISLPLPVWNRNQGNIKAGKYQVRQDEALLKMADQKLQNDVLAAYQKLQLAVQLASADNEQFYKDYYVLQKNIAESYNNRQINLVEFLEYYKDYQEVRENQLLQTLNLRLARLNLDDVTGTDVSK